MVNKKNLSKSLAVQYVENYPTEFSLHPTGMIYCNLCSTTVKSDKKWNLDHHRNTKRHQQLMAKSSTGTSTFLTLPEISENVVRAFLEADIPLNKLRNPAIKDLFKNLNVPIPSETQARRLLNKLAYEEIITLTRYFTNTEIFLIVDESEIKKTKYVNVLAGKISNPGIIKILGVIPLEVNLSSNVVNEIIYSTLEKFIIRPNNFTLLISDAASYMVKSASHFKCSNEKFIHVECLAHLVHNCAMRIKAYYTEVNDLISAIQAATIKCKSRIRLFESIMLPPKVIVTRWSSWLRCALYYSDNLPEIKKIVRIFEEDGKIVENAQKIVENVNLTHQLVDIKFNYEILISVLDNFENSQYNILSGYQCLQNIDFKNDPCSLKCYLASRLSNNGITEIISMKNECISPTSYLLLQNCPPTSISVERSFSMLKKLLASDRNFYPDNIYDFFSFYFNKSSHKIQESDEESYN